MLSLLLALISVGTIGYVVWVNIQDRRRKKALKRTTRNLTTLPNAPTDLKSTNNLYLEWLRRHPNMGMGDIAEAREAVRELQAIQSGKNPYETTITGKIKHDAPKDDICPECNEMVAMPEDDYICCKCRKKRK